MTNSILDTVKAGVGVPADYVAFDTEIMIYTNSAFSTLSELGVGPEAGFLVSNSSLWDEFLQDDATLNDVKQYVISRVKLAFDPPTTSFAINALKDTISELTWRINGKVDMNLPFTTESIEE